MNVIRIIATCVAVGALGVLGFLRMPHREMSVTTRRDSVAVARGVVGIDWQRRLLKGESLRVTGKWKGPRVKLLLMGVGTVLDSAAVDKEFVLEAVPAQEGRAVYSLVVLSGEDTLEREDIPVEVRQGRPLRVLLLAGSPDFENTFLFNWLSAEGDAVASRTTVSRSKYQTSFANMPERSLDIISPALLSDFDLVVADSGMVSPGAGVYIKKDSGNTSYALWMAGKRQEYAAYWSKILRRLARTKESEEWSWEPALPRVDASLTSMVSTGKAMPEGLLGEDVVYLAQDARLPFFWRGNYWPRRVGWFAARTPGGDTTWGYVWPADAWKGIYGGDREVTKATVMIEKGAVNELWIYVIFLSCVFYLWIERKIFKL